MTFVLHADGGTGIGLGHASRCGALSAALQRQGHVSRLVVDPSSGLGDYVRRLGVTAIEAGSDGAGVRQLAQTLGAHAVIVDSYRWTRDDFVALRPANCPVVAFDDEARGVLPVDGLINGAPAAAALAYDVLPHTRSWLGPAYQVVRDEFRDVPIRTGTAAVERVIVLVGGDDPLGLLRLLAAHLESLARATSPPFRCELICGPYTTAPDTVSLTHVEAVRHPADLHERMMRADLALSAGGQTLYELARCGTPTIAFRTGADQTNNLAALAAAGVVIDTGDASDAAWLARVSHALQMLAADAAARREMSIRGQGLIDGRGADRVAEAIIRLAASSRA